YLPGRAIRGDHSDDTWGELAARKVKADVVEVGVAPTVHDDLVPRTVKEAANARMGHKPPVGLPAQEQSIARRDDKQAPIGQEVDAKGKGLDAGDDFARALEIDGNDFLSAPVGEPQTVLVPARRLTEHEASQ